MKYIQGSNQKETALNRLVSKFSSKLFFRDKNYKERADKNKERIIKRDVKIMKKECIKEFNKCIRKGKNIAYVDFFEYTTNDFLDEISKRVLEELQQEHNNIEFSFCWRHFQNSYKGIKMAAL